MAINPVLWPEPIGNDANAAMAGREFSACIEGLDGAYQGALVDKFQTASLERGPRRDVRRSRVAQPETFSPSRSGGGKACGSEHLDMGGGSDRVADVVLEGRSPPGAVPSSRLGSVAEEVSAYPAGDGWGLQVSPCIGSGGSLHVSVARCARRC